MLVDRRCFDRMKDFLGCLLLLTQRLLQLHGSDKIDGRLLSHNLVGFISRHICVDWIVARSDFG